jgi:hypothetical protein
MLQDHSRVAVLGGALAIATSSALFLASFIQTYHRSGGLSRMLLTSWSAVSVLALFLLSILNIFLMHSVFFMVIWPLFGMALTVIGLVLVKFARPEGGWKLVVSNILLLILSFASIVAPN